MDENTLKLGSCVFPINKATFRYIKDNGEGRAGWEFDIETAENKNPRSRLYGTAPRFYAEGDPIPLPNVKDLTGANLHLKDSCDPESGEVYFTLYVYEHGDLTNLRMKFLEKKDKHYRIRVTANVPDFSRSTRLRIETWIKQLPAKSYG